MKTVGERVRELRKEKGNISQKDLARRIDVTDQTISRLERGDTKEPEFGTLRGIAEAFEMTVDELLEGTDYKATERFSPAIRLEQQPAPPLSADESDARGIRAQAVLNVLNDEHLAVTRDEFLVLQRIVDRLAASTGLSAVERTLRWMFMMYRDNPSSLATLFGEQPRSDAGIAETEAARERNVAKGHMPLKRSPPNG